MNNIKYKNKQIVFKRFFNHPVKGETLEAIIEILLGNTGILIFVCKNSDGKKVN